MTETNNGAAAPKLPPPVNEAIIDATLKRVGELQASGQLHLPPNYSPQNALRFAWLILRTLTDSQQKLVLPQVSRDSVVFSLLQMVMQGLNPAKRQCSFIKRGGTLTMQREYQGSIAIAKRLGVKSVVAVAVFDKDVFEYTVNGITGVKTVTKHEQTLESMAGAVKGAYAVVTMINGEVVTEIMPMAQIKAAWEQGTTKGESPAHKKFPDQMACKTVVNRAVKTIINSSDDADLEISDDNENDVVGLLPPPDATGDAVATEIEDKANGEVIDFPEDEAGETQEAPATQPTLFTESKNKPSFA
jgi:recombination protein RecT